MKMSEMTPEVIRKLSYEQKWDLCCRGIRDEHKTAEVALLLGTRPGIAEERALAAAQLFREGRVRTIIPSGGVEWDHQGERLCEADIMSRILKAEGVPEAAIIPEREAQTTIENMICGTLQMLRVLRHIPDGVIIVTSVTHMKRSIALAHALLPQKIEVSMYPSFPALSPAEWIRDSFNQKLLDNAFRFCRQLVENSVIPDIEL